MKPFACLRTQLLCCALLVGSATFAELVAAEDAPKAAPGKREKNRAKRVRTQPAKAQKKAEPPKIETRATPPKAGPRETDTNEKRAQEAARASTQGATSQYVKEGDTQVKVMTFTGLGIEGRLKSPQLLYFVHRVQTEFERPKLPHRSFMPELERTTQRAPIR